MAIEHVYADTGDDRIPAGRLLEYIARRPAWMADAACREHAEVEFVPPLPRTEDSAHRAREVCRRCLVGQECLAYALADPSLLGIWAGTTTAERRVMRREAKRAS